MFTSHDEAFRTGDLAEFVRNLVTLSHKIYGDSGLGKLYKLCKQQYSKETLYRPFS